MSFTWLREQRVMYGPSGAGWSCGACLSVVGFRKFMPACEREFVVRVVHIPYTLNARGDNEANALFTLSVC